MFLQTLLLTLTGAIVEALLAALTTRPAAALLATPTIELWTANSGVISPTMTYGQFTTAGFSGYAMQAITLAGPVTLGTNVYGLIANASFIATTASPFVPNTIAGYMLTTGTGTIYAAEQFASPVPIAAPTQFINLEFALPLSCSESL